MARHRNGFSLIELMIAVAIIAILAAIAIPRFSFFLSKTRRAEGIGILKGLYIAETAYFAAHDTYATDSTVRIPAHLGFVILQTPKWYDLSSLVLSADVDVSSGVPVKTNFEVMLPGNIDSDQFVLGADDWLEIYAPTCPAAAVFCHNPACGNPGVVNVAIDDLTNRFVCI